MYCLFLCACAHIHTYTHTYRDVSHTYTHTYIRRYKHGYIDPYIHTRAHTHTNMHSYIHTYIHTHIHTCTYISCVPVFLSYIHSLIYAYVHTFIYAYVHTFLEPTGPARIRWNLRCNGQRANVYHAPCHDYPFTVSARDVLVDVRPPGCVRKPDCATQARHSLVFEREQLRWQGFGVGIKALLLRWPCCAGPVALALLR